MISRDEKKEVNFSVVKDVAVIDINRPEKLNALNIDIVREIGAVAEQVARDSSIGAVILYSEKNFAAGADINGMADCRSAEARELVFAEAFNKIAELSVPTIAAMDGYALGGGLELALACDIRIASKSAKMGLPETGLGIMPGAGGTVRLPRLVGYAKAMELIVTGKIIDSEEAKEMGLVNMVVPSEELYTQAYKMATQIAAKPKIATKTAKRTINEGLELPVNEAIKNETEKWVMLFETEDQKEGMHAFIEKRKPKYKNR